MMDRAVVQHPLAPSSWQWDGNLLTGENIARHDNRLSRVRRTIEVDVYLHTVATSKDKLVSLSVLHRQFAVLLKSYLPYGITFHLKGTTETINEKWSRDGDEMGMKRALRAGGYRTLNIYYVEDLHGDLGYCYYPTDAPQGSEDFYRDGCSVLSSTVPGAPWPTSAWARRPSTRRATGSGSSTPLRGLRRRQRPG
ncbi:hypothetical protein V2G26_021055 [Clonostachys chloroleuca]